MQECDFEDAMTVAERACASILAERLDGKMWRGENPGDPECNVFSMAGLETGQQTTFQAAAYHFRATLDVYRRDRTQLQRDIMRIMRDYPITHDIQADDPLRAESNVQVFRIAPEPNSVSRIERVDVSASKDEKPIKTFAATIVFDVVFNARFE